MFSSFLRQSGHVSQLSTVHDFLLAMKICINFLPWEMEFISYLFLDSPLSFSKQFQVEAGCISRAYAPHDRNTLNMYIID